jgi:multisubunit Na+/H+ antiporter MnhB subunit
MNPLIGTGFAVLAVVVWIVCVIYAYQSAPKFGRSAPLWAFLTLIFSPIALMVLFVLPKKEPVHAAGSAHAKHTDPQDALYEVPKKKH